MKRSFVVLAIAALPFCACKKTPATVAAGDAAADASAASAPDVSTILRAEDQRRAKDIPDALRTSHDPAVRRAVARALSRIADDDSIPGLLRALSDEDAETIAWGAYGLGMTCRGHEDAHVRALAARAPQISAMGATSVIDPRAALARALGRCGGESAERTLAAWLNDPKLAPHAAYALGDVVAKRNAMSDETATALLDAKVDEALYPFGRIDHPPDAFIERLAQAARAALARPSDARLFAVRALGRLGAIGAADLLHVVKDKGFSPVERAEAAHGLARLGKDGRAAAADALDALVPDKDTFAIAQLGGDELGPLAALVEAVGTEPNKHADEALATLSRIEAPGNATPSLARRVAKLRCDAAAILARASYDADVLKKCDERGSEAFESARLRSLLQRHELKAERRAAWIELAKSKHVRVQEAALEGIGAHPELGEAARQAIAEALASGKPGLVATAADQIHAHPDRVFALAQSEIRAALDPNAPLTTNPKRELDPKVAAALRAALAKPWPEDLVETRVALMDAGVAVQLKEAKDFALAACRDPNVTMRQRAQKALATFADATPTKCAPPDQPPAPAPEIAAPLAKATVVRFDTDAGPLAIRFDPALAPIAATRFVALARAGFYNGIVVHRVVPGFVVQFGDPGGDGYGGAGHLLRCETSPSSFGPLDVGVALAGRDTGSSQLFVTLARFPHLDGEYALVGRAEGDWAAVAEGDAIREARIDE